MTLRRDKVAQACRRALSEIFLTHEALGAYHIVVMKVEVSPDIKTAHVYLGNVGSTDALLQQLMGVVKESKVSVRKSLAKKLDMKFVPELKFYWDQDKVETERLFQLLDEIAQEK